MFNSIDFSLPPKPSVLPPLFPYIENPAAAHASQELFAIQFCRWSPIPLFSDLSTELEDVIDPPARRSFKFAITLDRPRRQCLQKTIVMHPADVSKQLGSFSFRIMSMLLDTVVLVSWFVL